MFLAKYQLLGTSTTSWGRSVPTGSSDRSRAGTAERGKPSMGHPKRHVNTNNSIYSLKRAIIRISSAIRVVNRLERNERSYVAN